MRKYLRQDVSTPFVFVGFLCFISLLFLPLVTRFLISNAWVARLVVSLYVGMNLRYCLLLVSILAVLVVDCFVLSSLSSCLFYVRVFYLQILTSVLLAI